MPLAPKGSKAKMNNALKKQDKTYNPSTNLAKKAKAKMEKPKNFVKGGKITNTMANALGNKGMEKAAVKATARMKQATAAKKK
jgi:hypothetical protein